jgi:hypothetical protein
MTQAQANSLQKIITYECKSFITLTTAITTVNYDRKTFIIQATDLEIKGLTPAAPHP